MKQDNFNIIIAGYGGQGVLTLADIIARAAFIEGYDIKQAELHGLAQRGGSLQIHVRFGKKVFSPLVEKGKADLIISLDALESLRASNYANKNTNMVTNKKIFRINEDVEKILSKLKNYGEVYAVDADKIVEEMTGNVTSVNIFLLGFAVLKKLLPLKKENVLKAMEEKIRPEFLAENREVFKRALK